LLHAIGRHKFWFVFGIILLALLLWFVFVAWGVGQGGTGTTDIHP